MRRKAETVGVVDFGSREIRVLIARQDADGSVRVMGCGVAQGLGHISQGVIQDRQGAQAALHQALQEAEKAARVHVPSLFCGINGRNIETSIQEGSVELVQDVVEREHMLEACDIASRAVLAAGKESTPVPTAQEWYVDDMRVVNPLGIRGSVLKTRIFFVRYPEVISRNICSCVCSLGREVEELVFVPLASALGCLTQEDLELGALVIDMGHSATGLAIFRDNQIVDTHSFTWGGRHFTRDIVAGLQISFDEAEELLLDYGINPQLIQKEYGDAFVRSIKIDASSDESPRIKLRTATPGAPDTIDREELDVIVYERAKELLNKIHDYLNAHGLMRYLVRGVVLTGGGSVIRNQADLAQRIFESNCRVGLPVGVDDPTKIVHSPIHVASVGLVLHGLIYRAALRNNCLGLHAPARGIKGKLDRILKKMLI